MKKKSASILILLIIIFHATCFSQQTVNTDDKFLIVLDIQAYHTVNIFSEQVAEDLIDSVNFVINHFNSHNVIYVKTNHLVLNLSLTMPHLYITSDALAMRLDSRMNIVSKHIFTKDKSNAFSIAELNQFLKQNNAKKIVMLGLMAEECVYESLIAGKELGYEMHMVPQAIIGESEEDKMEVIEELKKKGIKVLDINTLKNKQLHKN